MVEYLHSHFQERQVYVKNLLLQHTRYLMPFSRKYFFAILQKEQVGVLNTITRGWGLVSAIIHASGNKKYIFIVNYFPLSME